ncbi:MAG: NADH-quinone oxidoreductase subunit NuoN [Burkholderiales bacterium]|nr:MAG: NADH-quinone oxidoreductase subunit NuoN [Burkholderiales bacterium]
MTLGAQLYTVLPEILLFLGASVVLLAELVIGKGRRLRNDVLALLVLIPPTAATFAQWGSGTHYVWSGMYVADELAHALKLCAYLAVAVTFVYGGTYARDRGMQRAEFYCLGLFALLGMMVMISAANLLVVYVGLELLSLSLYALAALRRDYQRGSEAAMKYFVLGALASGFLLYGLSMVYGGTGTLDLRAIAQQLATGTSDTALLAFGCVFIVAGLAFKFGAVPFHMWVPDVYDGTPTATTLLIAGAPKLAAFALTFRVLAEGLVGVAEHWQQMLVLLAVLSLAIGNLAAIAQTNLKRMPAYSTISHVGFVLLGMLSGVVGGELTQAGSAYGASMFYVITYVLTTLGTFGVILLMSREGFECDQIEDLKGLNRRAPWLAFVMLILMFSLAGIPPTVGFYAKLVVLQAVVGTGQIWLAVVAVLFSLVGAFYYLRVVKLMYFDAPADQTAIEGARDARALLGINGALALLLGIVPGPLMALCVEAVKLAVAS